MPCVDGFQATQRIKKEVPIARVIILSGAEDMEYREAARRSGADAFLCKSTMPTALVSAIQQIVQLGSP
jgi:DNA-binding NarL/FixJ family response regulator